MSTSTVQADISSAAEAAGIWSRSYRLLTLGLVLSIAAYAFESLSVVTAMPKIADELNGLSLYGWVFSAYMLTTIIGLTVAGTEADRSGLLRPFVIGVVLFASGLVLAGLAPTMQLLVIARVVQGLGGGLVGSIVYVIIGRKYPESSRPTMIALIVSVYVAPSLIGPALAGLVVEHLGWRWIFLGIAIIMPLALILVLPSIRQSNSTATEARDWRKIGLAARLAVGTALVTSGLGSFQTPFLAVILLAIGSVLAIPAFPRILPLGRSASHGIGAALVVAVLQNTAFFGVDAFVPFTLTSIRDQTITFAGLTLTAATISWTVSAWLQAKLVLRLSRRVLVTAGLVLITAGLFGIIAILNTSVPVAFSFLAWGVAGFGMGFVSPTLSLLAMELAPDDRQGTTISAMQIAGVLGIALGTGIGGVIIGNVKAGSGASITNIALHNLLMIGVLVAALWFARGLPGQFPKPAEGSTQ